MEPQSPQVQNTPSQNINTQYPAPHPAPQHNKPLFLILIALVIVVGALGYVTFFSEPKITGLEVAIKTTSFLDKTLQSDGSMTAGFVCDMATDQCNPIVLNPNQPDLSQAIYGYYELAKVMDNQSYRAKSDQAIDFVLDKCRTNFHMCDRNVSPIASYYLDTKDKKYLDATYSSAKKLLVLSNQDLVSQDVGPNLAILYRATGDDRYKKRLIDVANEELLSWPRGRDRLEYSLRVVWSVFIPAYTVTNDQKYLIASENFFDNFNLAENFDLSLVTPESIIKGVEALLSLSKMSDHGSVYKAKAHAALQEVLNQFWDNPENPKLNGDYGFGYASGTSNKYFKIALYNGWLIKLFAVMADEKFNLPTK
ncbi:MAG: hypothetical protein WAW81_00560 [Minisyncoccia bacterium]